ncbi:hypothetical protein E4T42_07432 [Aureobasidium subglaciale]|uniref:Uncharacterized protein n=1 Tax=Aureobasidium subglaciale (strain EXF-2481) TaxID=1043005 RepID=A0A074YJP8_AURSE|nr:uncharacterized protein AUEXF2481DRAFT_30295 [Aureobasidium subglaciale EXF-2481]KAI5209714.1 hypothetical protein E4T38_02211 [Aureobasidium subglaciale]KAI5228462.1 hypothetical protein E4T40_01990 [Aureobasidium subglaciale]KAI5231891.1 hypothetical protein E4T41_02210 [Aureobasidium subglaciale]KAI5243275.1 hypothetical protein E4T42_07432 [Aureobasidium subglaciale]KAI5265815.1 hypothetical protein E4T46_01988 [Aureobasidium subglaciale]
MAIVRSSSKDIEKQMKPKTETGLQKSPAKSPVKRGRKTTPTPPPTTRGSRSQSKARRPSVRITDSRNDEDIPGNSKSARKDKSPLQPLSVNISSDDLVETPVPANKLPRNYWLANSEKLSPPWISCSEFVRPVMVEFIMRSKKRLALGVKWEKGDKITNMEGAMHTFVTSIELAWLHGERGYDYGHTFTPYQPIGKFRSGRQVLVSNLVHQDFETDEVMLKLSSLANAKTTLVENFDIPTTKEKQSDEIREKYDDALRCLMVHYLTLDGELPSIEDGSTTAMSRAQAKSFLTGSVLKVACSDILKSVSSKWFWISATKPKSKTGSPLLSLEVLVTTAYHQFRNEMNALERICPQGYVYTFSAPKIFIEEFGDEDGLMACIYAAGLKHYLQTTKIKNMKVFQLPEVPGEWVQWMRTALAEAPGVRVMTKTELYSNESTSGDSYNPPNAGTVLVLHNCSDGFGQNIQYEVGAGSLDAIIGRFTSAAGSLLNSREDLVSMVAMHAE